MPPHGEVKGIDMDATPLLWDEAYACPMKVLAFQAHSITIQAEGFVGEFAPERGIREKIADASFQVYQLSARVGRLEITDLYGVPLFLLRYRPGHGACVPVQGRSFYGGAGLAGLSLARQGLL